jgi:hypothetical protein
MLLLAVAQHVICGCSLALDSACCLLVLAAEGQRC